MDKETLEIIRNNKCIYDYLREESINYKYLYRDKNYIKKIDEKAKTKYKIRKIDKIERLSNSLDSIKTFLDVLS